MRSFPTLEYLYGKMGRVLETLQDSWVTLDSVGISNSILEDLLELARSRTVPSSYFKRMSNRIRAYNGYYLVEESPVLVYTMYKVGSRTVRSVLRQALGQPVLHHHYLTKDLRKAHNRIIAGLCRKFGVRYDYGPSLANSSYLLHTIRRSSSARWKVVTLVRDPVARNLSLFFYFVNAVARNFLISGTEHQIKERAEFLWDCFREQQDEMAYVGLMDEWFDVELRKTFGVDVFSSDFDKRAGYKIYSGERSDVLVIRLEDLDTVCRDALRMFLGLEITSFSSANVGSSLGYGQIYEEFRNQCQFSSSYLDRLYNLRYMQAFYTPDEAGRLRERWEKRLSRL